MMRVKTIPFFLKLLLTLLTFLLLFILTNCQENSPTLFEWMPYEHTGIDFINLVEEGPGSNVLESDFFFNGAGVAVGDINNDGLPDIFFTANTGENALYLNLGHFQFRDITKQAGISDSTGWSAGTAMVDIDGNGLLDIYICKAGDVEPDDRKNRLFINNGDSSGDGQALSFTERAAEYGLDDPGYCTQAVFFDYDGDGDLDVFIVNYSVKPRIGFDIGTIRDEHDPYAGDKLYRNDTPLTSPLKGGSGVFTDVSKEAGILQNPIAFGLSATVSDLNNNGWPDIYVANDFMERDYMYINQGDGTFQEQVLARTDVISYFSMGIDIADLTNDGLPDILVVDMLPYDYARRRMFNTPDYSMYDYLAAYGYHRQNMRNMLQINNGDGTFTEVGQLAGISKTDWSWAPLIADFDNDGRKDIFITNGYPRFYTNLDYLNDVLWDQFPDYNFPSDDSELLYDLVRQMEKVEMHNFVFKNQGDLAFSDVSESWGVNQYSVSSGAAYADLDNDGALDLIISNINERPFIFKNNARKLNKNHFLKVRLQGSDKNRFGVGAKVKITGNDGSTFSQENFPVRGYQSSVDPVLLFGLGDLDRVDVEVTWPDQAVGLLENIPVNQTITVNRKDARFPDTNPSESQDQHKMFMLLNEQLLGIDFSHQGNFSGDRVLAPLLPHTLTNLGPALTSGDVNNDGLQDIFIGGGQGQAAALYLQQQDGTYIKAIIPVFEVHNEYEDTDALFFDANGNGHPDLYVVSGGNHDPLNGRLYQDRLYINNGFGRFIYKPDALPEIRSSGGIVTPADIDADGDADLFVGGRALTGKYPLSPRSYLLKNNNGKFTDITEQVSPDLMNPGMVTGAVWADIDNDGRAELIIAGEWMPIRIFRNNGDGAFTEMTEEAGLENTSGWWNVLKAADLNGDGFPDLMAGNRGLNTSLHATPEEPVILFAGDFNNDSFIDPIMTNVIEGNRYPAPGRDRLLQQLPDLGNRFPDYESYSTAAIEDILSRRQMRNAAKFYVHTFASTVFKNNGDGSFQTIPLPRRAQTAPIFDLIVADFDNDEIPDILAAGNNFGTRPETGPMAGQGIMLKGEGKFTFTSMTSKDTGFRGVGDIRKLELVSTRIGALIVLGRYANTVMPYVYTGPRVKER